MELCYSSNKLKKILENERLLKKHFSNDFKKIGNRLTELKVAENLSCIPDVPPPRRHKLTGQYSNCWGIDISKNDRIVISPVGDFNIHDLTTIDKVEIMALGDYH